MIKKKDYPVINFQNIICKFFLISLFVFYFINIFFFPESFVQGGSGITNWAYFKDILSGFNDFDKTGLQEERWNYAEFRWGFYVIPLIFNSIFSNQINVFFLTTPIIVFFCFGIFFFTLKKHLSIYSIIFFSVCWIMHPEIYDFIYSFSTNGVSLLVLSIIVLFISKYDIEKISLTLKIALILLFFWFYGVKETNLMFAPFLLFLFKRFNLKHFLIISSLSIILYLGESIAVYFLSEKNISYGRLFYQLFDSSPHAWSNIIKTNLTKLGNIAEQNLNTDARSLADGAIFSRWYFTGLTLNFYYYIAFVLSFLNIFNNKNDHFIKHISWLYLSFFFTLSFALIKIFPPQPFVHLSTNIQIIVFPLALILFCKFLDEIFKKSHNKFFNIFFLIFLLILLNIKSLNHYYKVGIKDIANTKYNLFNVDKYIENFTNKVNSFNCLSIKGDPLLLYHAIDKNLNSTHKKNINKFINEDTSEYVKIVTSGQIYQIPLNSNCKNSQAIYKFRILD